MNIKEAKQELINTVRAYLAKDELGEYRIPVQKQRPVLLMGPPGIGKTAVMEQVAKECNISLVSYTITHHTRQSAIGLPFIEKKCYGGREVSVTEYTMSEIIAAVYDQIERSGISEGILFLDEINCVSETLAPTMLQFLQYKTFGNHGLPDGFLIVTAGNPPEYNKSVRDFDIVTYDRVKRIFIEEDYGVWKEYAYRVGVHGSILAYLEIKKKNFYSVVSDVEGKRFVTARGWEDLSVIIQTYEQLGIPVTFALVVQYVQDAEIARDFAAYYELYNKYRNVYRIPDILEGLMPELSDDVRNAPFDEKLSLIALLIDRLNQDFQGWEAGLDCQREFLDELKRLREELKAGGGRANALLMRQRQEAQQRLAHRRQAGLLTREEERTARSVDRLMEKCIGLLAAEGCGQAREDFAIVKGFFDKQEEKRQQAVTVAGRHLTNAFDFLVHTFGEGQELVIFLSELSAGYYSLKYVSACGNEAYYKYNRLLLLKDRGQELKREAMHLLGFGEEA
ncbi:MAG: AAA family ATPase [Blautia sp.]|nr:AAA family ATPase [Blautia sp.]